MCLCVCVCIGGCLCVCRWVEEGDCVCVYVWEGQQFTLSAIHPLDLTHTNMFISPHPTHVPFIIPPTSITPPPPSPGKARTLLLSIISLTSPHLPFIIPPPRLYHPPPPLPPCLQGKLEHSGYFGLNWKSLSQPAILPSSTDFLVPLRELQDEDKFEIQGNSHTLLLFFKSYYRQVDPTLSYPSFNAPNPINPILFHSIPYPQATILSLWTPTYAPSSLSYPILS